MCEFYSQRVWVLSLLVCESLPAPTLYLGYATEEKKNSNTISFHPLHNFHTPSLVKSFTHILVQDLKTQQKPSFIAQYVKVFAFINADFVFQSRDCITTLLSPLSYPIMLLYLHLKHLKSTLKIKICKKNSFCH